MARFLHKTVMDILRAGRNPLTFEDRVERLSQLALLLLLITTLSGVVL
jgi:hypothetical protein